MPSTAHRGRHPQWLRLRLLALIHRSRSRRVHRGRLLLLADLAHVPRSPPVLRGRRDRRPAMDVQSALPPTRNGNPSDCRTREAWRGDGLGEAAQRHNRSRPRERERVAVARARRCTPQTGSRRRICAVARPDTPSDGRASSESHDDQLDVGRLRSSIQPAARPPGNGNSVRTTWPYTARSTREKRPGVATATRTPSLLRRSAAAASLQTVPPPGRPTLLSATNPIATTITVNDARHNRDATATASPRLVEAGSFQKL